MIHFLNELKTASQIRYRWTELLLRSLEVEDLLLFFNHWLGHYYLTQELFLCSVFVLGWQVLEGYSLKLGLTQFLFVRHFYFDALRSLDILHQRLHGLLVIFK